jgi:hypothetical protein
MGDGHAQRGAGFIAHVAKEGEELRGQGWAQRPEDVLKLPGVLRFFPDFLNNSKKHAFSKWDLHPIA